MEKLIERINNAKVQQEHKGICYNVLSLKEEVAISFDIYIQSKKTSVPSLKEIHLESLKNNIIPTRYFDNVIRFGIENQIKLLNLNVAIVGLGRVGSQVAEMLGRMGIGKLTLIDDTTVKENNLSSQSTATTEHISLTNSIVMSLRLRDINPAVEVDEIEYTLDESNVAAILNAADLVISSNSNKETFRVLADYSRKSQKPVVFCLLDGDKGTVCSLSKSNDFKVRKNLFEKEIDISTLPHVVSISAGTTISEVLTLISFGRNNSSNECIVI